MKHPRIIAEISRHQWAITPLAMEGILLAINGELTAEDSSRLHRCAELGAVTSLLGEQVPDTRMSRISSGIGSLNINGPIVPYASILENASGAVSVERAISELVALDANAEVSTILVVFDSPGGSVTGVTEFVAALRAVKKPTIAYAYGYAASAAYWWASAADRIYAADTALVGSVGVITTIRVTGSDRYRVIGNSQSPLKAPEPGSDEHVEDTVRVLDRLADVFIDDVAAGRRLPSADVIEKFGRGSLLSASEAANVCAIDGIMSLSDLMANLRDHNPLAAGPDVLLGKAVAVDIPAASGYSKKDESMEENMEDFEVRVAEAKKEAHEEARVLHASRVRAARPVLAGTEYPESIRALALDVIEGKCEVAALDGAISVIDALRAEAEQAAAIGDSADAPETVAASPEDSVVSGDGVIRSASDFEAEIARLKEVI